MKTTMNVASHSLFEIGLKFCTAVGQFLADADST
jgi:hypothetical protein